MYQKQLIAAQGTWGTVEWAVLPPPTIMIQARQFYLAQTVSDGAKVLALFQRLADFGRISNREKFKQLGERAGIGGRGLWEFKSFQLRFIGDYRPGRRFIIVYGLRKKKDDLRMSDIEASIANLDAWDKHVGA